MLEEFRTLCATAIGKILLALVIFILGSLLIKSVLKLLEKSRVLNKAEGTVSSFTKSFVKIAMYTLLVVIVVGVLGVEMTSIAAVIASAGVTIGLALQGALSNLAGGIMIMIFKPFKQGDFIEATGVAGSVIDVTMFYTVIATPDNKRVTIPNGSLMNSNITDYSAQGTRRVDLTVSVAKSEDVGRVIEIICKAIGTCPQIIEEPEGPFASVSGGTNEAIEFAARAWCKSEDYWTVYFDMNNRITAALAAAGVKAPAVRVIAGK